MGATVVNYQFLVECGVSQGSVLGPLFLLYINAIYNLVPEEKIKLFADDTNIAAKSASELEVKVISIFQI